MFPTPTPSPIPGAHDDLLRRLDDMPIPRYEREVAKAQMRIAFLLVDKAFEAVDALRAGFVALRRYAAPRVRART